MGMAPGEDPTKLRRIDWNLGTLNIIALSMTFAVILAVFQRVDATVLVAFEGPIVGFYFGKLASGNNQKRQHRSTDPTP